VEKEAPRESQVGRHGWLNAELEIWLVVELLEEKQTYVYGHSEVIEKPGLDIGYWNPVVRSENVALSHVQRA